MSSILLPTMRSQWYTNTIPPERVSPTTTARSRTLSHGPTYRLRRARISGNGWFAPCKLVSTDDWSGLLKQFSNNSGADQHPTSLLVPKRTFAFLGSCADTFTCDISSQVRLLRRSRLQAIRFHNFSYAAECTKIFECLTLMPLSARI